MAQAISLEADEKCFVCGKDNPSGLQIEWKTSGHVTVADFYPSAIFQGWKGIVHGGILSTVMDEAMTRLAWEVYGGSVTAELKIRFYNTARVGEKLSIRGEIGEEKNRLIVARSEIRNKKGRLIAAAQGKVIRLKDSSL